MWSSPNAPLGGILLLLLHVDVIFNNKKKGINIAVPVEKRAKMEKFLFEASGWLNYVFVLVFSCFLYLKM